MNVLTLQSTYGGLLHDTGKGGVGGQEKAGARAARSACCFAGWQASLYAVCHPLGACMMGSSVVAWGSWSPGREPA